MRSAFLELQARYRLLDARMTQVQELLGGEVLQINFIELGGSHEDRVVGEVDGLGGLVRGELVPQDEVSPLVAPLHDGHQMLVGSTQVYFALEGEKVDFIKRRKSETFVQVREDFDKLTTNGKKLQVVQCDTFVLQISSKQRRLN